METKPDYVIQNHGTLFLFYAQTEDALKNLKANVSEEAQWWGRDALVVEPRYAQDLAERLQAEGWVVE